MAAASRDVKRSKIEVQLKLFSEQMDYQREKDRRLYESSLIANKNTRLAIIKQGEVVSCLAQLSSVLQMGLNVSSQGNRGGVPQSTATTGASVEAKSNAPAAPTSTLSFSPSAALGPTTAPDTCAADAPPQC
jgi:hypothetical protein